MAERLKRAAAWLGLVTDERYSEYEQSDGTAEVTETVERTNGEGHAANGSSAVATSNVTQLPTKRPASSEPAAPTTSSTPRTADVSRIITVHPRTYNEARTIGEHFRDGVPVIMNLSEMEDLDAKRLVDFAAGLIFGLRGTIERVTSKVFLLSPQNVNVTAEDKERIAGGFFNQS